MTKSQTKVVKAGAGEIVYGMPIDEYHEKSAGISSTAFRELMKSPNHLAAYYAKEEEYVPHFDFGNATELALLDPDGFATQVYIAPESEILADLSNYKSPRSTKAYKDWWEYQQKAAAGRYLIKDKGPESHETIKEILKEAETQPMIQALLRNIEYQASCFWTDAETGIRMKTRPDIANVNREVAIDVKTSIDASPTKFLRQAREHDLAIQAGFQVMGITETKLMHNVELYYYLVLEKNAPYNVQLYRLSQEDITNAIATIKHYLRKWKEYSVGNYGGYAFRSDNKHHILDLEMGSWYWTKFE